MKKLCMILLSVIMVYSVTACGMDLSTYVEIANENKQAYEENVSPDMAADNGYSLEDAIAGAMEDEGVDIIDNEGKLIYEIPSDFTYNEEYDRYMCPDYTAEFYYMTELNDGSFCYVTEVFSEEALKESLREKYGSDLNLTITSWENITVSGYDAVCYSCEYTRENLDVVRNQIIVDGTKKFHSIVFDYIKGSEYADRWETLRASLKFE